MSVILGRHVTLETVGVERFTGVDGQGLPTYDTSIDFDVRPVRKDKVIVSRDGSNLKTELTMWIPFDADVAFPDERDRVTFESTTFIVEEVKDVKDSGAQIHHRRCRCRRS